MDWLETFKERFKGRSELSDIKQQKFHGNLTINFCDGVPINCNMNTKIVPTQTKGG